MFSEKKAIGNYSLAHKTSHSLYKKIMFSLLFIIYMYKQGWCCGDVKPCYSYFQLVSKHHDDIAKVNNHSAEKDRFYVDFELRSNDKEHNISIRKG